MLKNLILPFSIYRLHVKMHSIHSRIKKMESFKYLDLKGRMDVAQMKKLLASLQEQEASMHFTLSL